MNTILKLIKKIRWNWIGVDLKESHTHNSSQYLFTPFVLFHGFYSWWRHQMENFSALLAISAGNSPVIGEFPTQRPVTRSFDIFFDLRVNKRLSKQWWGWWFHTLSRPLWRHRNEKISHQCATATLRWIINVQYIDWINTREAGDLRRHCAHYDIIVMCFKNTY